jgi:hypothetical protein
MPMNPNTNRDRVRLEHAFSRFRLGMQAIMSVYRTRGVKTQHRPAGDANSIVRHHAQHQADMHGPSITTRSPVLRTPSNRSRNVPTRPPGLLRMRTSSAIASAPKIVASMMTSRTIRIHASFIAARGDRLNRAKFAVPGRPKPRGRTTWICGCPQCCPLYKSFMNLSNSGRRAELSTCVVLGLFRQWKLRSSSALYWHWQVRLL